MSLRLVRDRVSLNIELDDFLGSLEVERRVGRSESPSRGLR